MTTSKNTTSTTKTATESAGFEVGTTVHVAPSQLLLKRNIRSPRDDAAFKDLVRSVKSVGVLQAITAVLTTDHGLLVRFGERRALAAIEAGDGPVPVYIAGHDSDETTAEIERLVTQRDENTHRTGLTTAEDLAVVEQLAAFGLTAAQITKRTRIKRADVDTALAVAGSDLARKATERYEALTLDQASVVAEFEDDPDTVKALIAASATGQFDHVVQRARNDRDDRAARQAVLDTLTEAEVTVVDRPDYGARTVPLTRLTDPSTDQPVTLDQHRACPGHVGWAAMDWILVDAEGNPLAEDADLTPEQEDQAHQVRQYVPLYGCTDPAKHGHRDKYHSPGSGQPKAADLSETERAAAKKARKLVIENNRAWDAADTVRREWVAAFAARRTPPKGTGGFLATALTKDPSLVQDVGGSRLAAEWLGASPSEYGQSDFAKVLATATENRALVIALVRVLGSYEAHTDRMDWRRDGTHAAHGRYLRFLHACGYTLSEVEQYAISKKTG